MKNKGDFTARVKKYAESFDLPRFLLVYTRFPVDQSGEYDVSTTSEPLKHQVKKDVLFSFCLCFNSNL